jgi:cation-transporting ATPase E
VARDELERALASYAASAPARSATLETIAGAFPGTSRDVRAHVAFASRRRWGAIELGDGTLVLGAPELVAAGPLLAAAGDRQRAGRRVVAIARTEGTLDGGADPALPHALQPLGLVVRAERLRKDAQTAVAYFRERGVQLKILSGDAPATVAAIAATPGSTPAASCPGTICPRTRRRSPSSSRRSAWSGGSAPRASATWSPRSVAAGITSR